MLILGVIGVASGAWMAFWPNRQARAAEARIASGEAGAAYLRAW